MHSNDKHGAEGTYKLLGLFQLNCIIDKRDILLNQVSVKIPVEDRELDGVFNLPCDSSWNGCAVVLTHGAGGDMSYLHLEKLAAHLASTGILCLRFTCRTRNFQYRTECFAAVVVSFLE